MDLFDGLNQGECRYWKWFVKFGGFMNFVPVGGPIDLQRVLSIPGCPAVGSGDLDGSNQLQPAGNRQQPACTQNTHTADGWRRDK